MLGVRVRNLILSATSSPFIHALLPSEISFLVLNPGLDITFQKWFAEVRSPFLCSCK